MSDATAGALGWAYVQGLRQVGAFDCMASAVSLTKDPQGDGDLFALNEPLSMADLFSVGVVMADDLEEAERHLAAPAQDLTTKERGSLLKLLSIMLADGYRYDPQNRSTVAAEICEAGADMGLSISENTVLKFLRQALAEHPPERHQAVQRI